MKDAITYRTLTIAVGILVAVLVIVALWMSNPIGDTAAAQSGGEQNGLSLIRFLMDKSVSLTFSEVRF
jgi:preprotein translocase subunit SecG